MPRILVINPNSNESVTQGLRESLEGIDADIDCCTIASGPFGIETDDDIAGVVPLVVDQVMSSPDYDGYVIACYSDPGLAGCREKTSKPVRGIQHSAIESAIRHGGNFGVVALSRESVSRHLRYIESLGYSDRLAAELPLGISVDDSANAPDTLAKVIHCGRRLIDEFGAKAIILGCAGMAAHKKPAADALRVPVIEPVEAAVKAVLAEVS